MLKFPVGGDQFVAQVLGVRGHEAYARHAEGVHPAQQFGKFAAAAAVGIDVLPQQRDLLDPLIDQTLALLQHGLRLTRTLPTAHIGYDAVRAEVVAAVHDVDEGGKGADAPLRQALGDDAVAGQHLHHRAAAFQHPQQVFGQAVHVVRAEHQVDEGIHGLHPLGHARFLRHAAAHTDEQLRALLFQLLEPDDIAQRAVLGVFAHTAGVVEDEVCLFPLALRAQAHLHEHASDGLRIPLVHLAAHGDDVKAARPFGQGAHALGKVALARKFAFGYDKSFVHSISSVHSFNSFAPLGGVSGANGSKRYSASAMFSSASTRTMPAFAGAPSLSSMPATGGAANTT